MDANTVFKYPFRELYFWAVLNNMVDMAQFLWAFEEEAMSKAIIATEMSNALLENAQSSGLQEDVVSALARSTK